MKKILILSATVFLLAAGCNKASNTPAGQQNSPAPNQQSQTQQAPPRTTDVTTSPAPKGMTQTRQNAGMPDYTPGFVIVTQTVQGSNLNTPYNKVKEGETAEDLLQATHKVEVKTYSFGDMVISIDGIKPDSKHFWAFLVNGAPSNVGAGSYKLKNGDKIEWQLSAIGSYE